MKIIIVGAGRIGTNLAKSLASENTEVYLIDINAKKIGKIAEKLDVKAIIGNGADPDTLVASVRAYVNALNKLLVKRAKTAPEALTA